jgi:hypothetical protein
MRRARKRCAVDPVTGERIPFPRLSQPRAGLPHAEWLRLPPWEKIELQLGMSLDRCYQIISWPRDQLDMAQLAVQAQVLHVLIRMGARVMFDGTLDHERNRRHIVEEFERKLDEAAGGQPVAR